MSAEHRLALPAGYELGKYRFREVLGSGGFGITYLAEDRMLSRRVAVKELLPNDIATRIDGATVAAKTQAEEESLTWARERFVNEGRALAACDHPNVVHVYEMVEANGTAYMVTKYEEGRSLEKWLKELGRPPSEEELHGIVMPLLSGLEKVHGAGFLHRDIKPDNIYLTSEGRPVLLDFGSARQAVSNRSMAMTSIVTSGYAPFEQYYEDGNQGPWSDIYAMGAVMYRAIVGKKPPEATRRLKDDPCEKLAAHYQDRYSSGFLRAIDKALSVNESKRPQSVTEWREMLGDDLHEAATFVRPDRGHSRGSGGLKELLRARPWIAPAAGVGLIAIAAGAWQLSRPKPVPDDNKGKKIAVVSPTPSAIPAITPTPGPEPTSTPMNLVNVSPTPGDGHLMPNPWGSPSPSPASIETPTPNPLIPIASPTAAPVAAVQVDPQLVGSWQTGSTKSKRIHWQIWPDGNWVCYGLVNDSGTLTASTGQLKQFSNTTQQWLDTAYEFQDDNLITHNQLGSAEWHRVNGSTAQNTPTPRHRSSGGQGSSGNDAGRQIFNRFMQGRGIGW